MKKMSKLLAVCYYRINMKVQEENASSYSIFQQALNTSLCTVNITKKKKKKGDANGTG